VQQRKVLVRPLRRILLQLQSQHWAYLKSGHGPAAQRIPASNHSQGVSDDTNKLAPWLLVGFIRRLATISGFTVSRLQVTHDMRLKFQRVNFAVENSTLRRKRAPIVKVFSVMPSTYRGPTPSVVRLRAIFLSNGTVLGPG
jgi:hypothetical protein